MYVSYRRNNLRPRKPKKRGKKRKYPWDKWVVDHKEFLIVKGRDYSCTTNSMIVMLRSRAVMNDKIIRTVKIVNSVCEGIKFSFYSK